MFAVARDAVAFWLVLFGIAFSAGIAFGADPCAIEIVERGSGWPVPLIELRTTNDQRFVSDNAGRIAFDAPEYFGRETWFQVIGDGYEVPKDGFGFRGVRLTPKAGATLRIEVTRTQIAKRLGRSTGAGLFAESQKLGSYGDWRESGVTGCDSIQLATYHGRLFWAWGDTNLPHYPLGVFDMTGATTTLSPLDRFEPPLAIHYDYFRDEKGIPVGIAKMPGSGPTWLSALVTLPDATGHERLVASYVKIKPPLEPYESGLCVWNDTTKRFDRRRVLWRSSGAPKSLKAKSLKAKSLKAKSLKAKSLKAKSLKAEPAEEKPGDDDARPPMPSGHAVFDVDSDGVRWVMYGNPFPTLKHRATFEAWSDPKAWQRLEPLRTLHSANDQHEIEPHTGSIAWNPYRKRWVAVFMEAFGSPSPFGELWYAESNHACAGWGPAVKILSHANYTFYNPRLHPELTAKDAPFLLFEGTYTKQFSRQQRPTPRYDYNQILYRIELDEPALQAARKKD